MSEYQDISKEMEIEKQSKLDIMHKNEYLIERVSQLENQVRENYEAEEKLRVITEMKEDTETELDIIKKRLMNFDPTFRFENQVFMKIVNILKKAKVSPKEAFEEFDETGDGLLDKHEFISALEKMRIEDLSTRAIDVLWNSLDIDNSGKISVNEFLLKLERYGVKNRTLEEQILTQML